MAKYDVEVKSHKWRHKDETDWWVHMDLGYHDGGDHGRDLPCWRNISPEQAIELGKELLVKGLIAKVESEH